MSAESSRAVFLSYASQDAEAARRICETLRESGVEVWFDADGGLEHGDEWDAKIRRQIKECVLFIPVISANTQAREEGYFRLEWDLAAERARTIASGVPFVLPVVIDDTREPDALVPDRFRMVQWTKLPGGVVTPEVKARYLKLWSHRTGLLKSKASADPAPENPSPAPASSLPTRSRGPLVLGISAAVVAVGLGIFLTTRPAPPPVAAPTAAKSPAPAASPAPSKRYASSRPDVATLLTRVQAMTDKTDVARAELETALNLLDQAATRDSADANVWAERALVEFRYIRENLDTTSARIDAALQHAKQATSLDPKNPNARLAAALTQSRADTNQASRDATAAIFESLVAENTDRADAYFALAAQKLRNRQAAEAFALLDQAARLPGFAGRAGLQKAVTYVATGEFGQANEALDQALAVERSAAALLWKSYLATIWLGDAALAKQAIAGIPAGMLTEDFPAAGKLFVALWARDWDTAIASMRAIPRNYLGSGALSGPTGYYIGYALDRAGRKSAAEIEWRSALEVVNKRLESDPQSRILFAMKALLLAALGDRAGGEKILQTLRELYPTNWDAGWTGHMLSTTLLPPEEAIAKLARPGTDAGLSGSLKLDPFLDHLRAHPKFAELLAKAEANSKLNPAAPPTLTPATADPKSVAVLPFVNGSGDKDNEFFSDGISEELINALLKVPGLKVPASTSSFHFKGKDTPLAEIARQLNVAHIVEGNVRKVGTRVRITAKLIKAADGFPVWSSGNIDLDRELKDVLALQEEIAGRIASALQLKLGAPATAATVNPAAYGLLLQGRFAARQESNAGRKQSIEFFRRAVGLEPGYALAWAEMAQSYIRLARFGGMSTVDGMKEARQAAQKSLELDPDQPIALDAMGWVQRTADWDWRAAQKSFQRALALAPENSAILADASIIYHNTGRRAEALAFARQAAERDPLNAMAQINLGDILWNTDHLQEGVDQMSKGIRLAPEVEEFRTHLAIALAQLKRFPEAVAMVEAEPNAAYRLFGRGYVASLRGDHAARVKAREELVAQHGASMTGYIAMLYTAEGNRDEAFAWLERAYRERDSSVCWVKTAVLYTELRSDPRWPVYLRKLGLADEQLK